MTVTQGGLVLLPGAIRVLVHPAGVATRRGRQGSDGGIRRDFAEGESRWAITPRAGMAMTVNVDELGTVDWIVVEFPGTKLTGEIAPIIKDYEERGLIKVLDLLFLKKDEDGSLEAFEASDLGVGEIGELRGYEKDLAMVLSEQDVADLADTIGPGSSAAVLVWENLWSAPLAAAVRHAGGQLTASGRIPTQAVLAAIETDAEQAGEGV